MKVLTKYGTFLIIPIVLAGIAITLCTLKVREKIPATLICLSKDSGIVYIPQGTKIQTAKGEHLRLETSHSAYIECQITDVAEEPANKRINVKLSYAKGMDDNSICDAYIITNEAVMLDLVFRKILMP